MKFAIASDLHLDVSAYMPLEFETAEQLDFVIIAGDLSPNKMIRDWFLETVQKTMNCPVIFIPGNHDYYANQGPEHATILTEINGVKIAAATLWTKLGPLDWLRYKSGLNDCRYIKDWDEAAYTAAHEYQKHFLLNSRADIIVSHHAPSWQSIHPDYKDDPLNAAFASDLDEEIRRLQPRFWFHGHVHNNFDYKIGQTRVICHPRGYHFEFRTYKNYKPMVIEI